MIVFSPTLLDPACNQAKFEPGDRLCSCVSWLHHRWLGGIQVADMLIRMPFSAARGFYLKVKAIPRLAAMKNFWSMSLWLLTLRMYWLGPSVCPVNWHPPPNSLHYCNIIKHFPHWHYQNMAFAGQDLSCATQPQCRVTVWMNNKEDQNGWTKIVWQDPHIQDIVGCLKEYAIICGFGMVQQQH